jgi:hypothetical protein
MLIVLSASLPKIYFAFAWSQPFAIEQGCRSARRVCGRQKKQGAAIACNAIELDGSCHGFPVLLLAI